MSFRPPNNFGTGCLLVLLMLMTSVCRSQDMLVNADDFFDITFGDLQEELATVREEGKSALMVMFETKDCPWCERMKKQVLNRATVHDFYKKNFRAIALDAEGDLLVVDFDGNDIPEKEFALKSLRVRATPVFVFFNSEGEAVTRYTGALKDAKDFILLGKYVLQEKYRDMRFSKYRRESDESGQISG